MSTSRSGQLPPQTRRERLRTIAVRHHVFVKARSVEQLPGGYALAHVASDSNRRNLAAFCTSFSNAYPSLDLNLVDDPARGLIWPQITGPHGTKELIDQKFRLYRTSGGWNARWRRAVDWGLRRLTSGLRVTPDYLIIGAARSGTTSLHSYLSHHPQIRVPLRKEIGYFDRQYHLPFNWYRAHFPTRFQMQQGRGKFGRPHGTGEATPEYLFHPHTPQRVRDLLPDVRLIALLRDPVERAYSHYCLSVTLGLETLSFEEAIERESQRLEGEMAKVLADPRYFSTSLHRHSYIARGVYVDQIERWLRVFPREQMLILAAEQFERHRTQLFRQVLDFLGLQRWDAEKLPKHHGIPRIPMSAESRRRLDDYFEPHNRRLRDLVGGDFDWDPR